MGRRRGVPVVAMRGLAALPGGAVHFEISRRRSMAAIEYGMLHNMKVLLVAQKDPMEIDPGPDGLHAYGTLCEVRQLARLPMDRGRCMVEGQKRCKVVKVYSGKDMFTAEIVEEEISVFLGGASLAEDCAKKIQSRAGIWLSEHQ